MKLAHALRTGVALVALVALAVAGTQIDTNIVLKSVDKPNNGAAQGNALGQILDVQLPYRATQQTHSNLQWVPDDPLIPGVGSYYNTDGAYYRIGFTEFPAGSHHGTWSDSDGHSGAW